jgi:hypothetical protein
MEDSAAAPCAMRDHTFHSNATDALESREPILTAWDISQALKLGSKVDRPFDERPC